MGYFKAMSAVLVLSAAGTHFFPQTGNDHGMIRGAVCVAGPSPCRATNSVQCLGAGCTGNWDECLIAYEASPFNCLNNDQKNGNPTHCIVPGCTLTCSELCWDANGNAAGDINNQ